MMSLEACAPPKHVAEPRTENPFLPQVCFRFVSSSYNFSSVLDTIKVLHARASKPQCRASDTTRLEQC